MNEMATDNAVSCLGRIVEHHADVLDAPAVIGLWLSHLPLKGDTIEAQVCWGAAHRDYRGRRAIGGGGGEHKQQCVWRCLDDYADGHLPYMGGHLR